MTYAARFVLFVSSYAPLLILFGVLHSFGAGWPRTACFATGIASIVLLALGWAALHKTLAFNIETFDGARTRDADVMSYVATYVVPFAAAANGSDTATRWALAVFAVVIAALYIRSAVFYVHPLLLLCGIHVYEATREGVPVTLLTRQPHLRQECQLQVVRISQNVYSEVHR